MFVGSRARPVRRAENLTAVSRVSRQCGVLNISQSYRSPEPVTGITLLFFTFYFIIIIIIFTGGTRYFFYFLLYYYYYYYYYYGGHAVM
jgi:hypothetical protein